MILVKATHSYEKLTEEQKSIHSKLYNESLKEALKIKQEQKRKRCYIK